MITQLLQTIINMLQGWIDSFNSHAQHMEDKIDSIDSTASDIKTDADNLPDIKDNTAAIITPIQSIKSNTDSISTSSSTTASNTTAILNNIGTLATNTGSAAAFAEDCANNTLNILDKVTTIASDTTQIRANTNAIQTISDTLKYYFITNIVTEDSEGVIANFDTDLEDYLQACKVTIPADPTGYSGITLSKIGKNIIPGLTAFNSNGLTTTVNADGSIHVSGTATGTGGYITASVNFPFILKTGLQITASVSTTLNTNLRMIFNNGVLDISANTKSRTITLTNDVSSGRLYLYTTANQSYDITFRFQIEIGSAATSYEAYQAETYSVSFGSTITDGAEADLLNGIVKINTTPVTYGSFTPIIVRTYKGVNNIVSDVGTTAVTYRETLKNYLDKHNQ